MNDKNPAFFTRAVKMAPPRGLYFLIFAISGFSGLIYESIWSHYLKLFLGHAAYAQSLVLIIFMGGMALGSWLASRWSRRSKIPILIYAAAELIVGILAMVFHNVFTGMMEMFYGSILPAIGTPVTGAVLKWFAASLLITPQSILLGMTFPLMSAGIIRRYPDTPGGSISMLYFTNSIGAATGVLASGFLMIGALGLPGTMLSAGLLNIALAIIVWVLIRLDPQAETAPLAGRRSDGVTTSLNNVFVVAAFITGAASFIYEIGWIRMLSLVLGATTHSFELMLSAFITGLAFGGLWIKRRIDRIADPVRFSAIVQITMGVLAVLTIPVYMYSFDWMEWLLGALRSNDAGFVAFSMASHIIALSVMLPATFMAGMTLPLFTYVLICRGHGEASIGRIYAANTLGAIAGVLFAVHMGLPLLGLKRLIVFGAMLDIALGIYLMARADASRRRTIRIAASALIGLGTVALTLGTVEVDKSRLISGVFRVGRADIAVDDKIVYYLDGKTATVSLRLRPDGIMVLSTNGKPDAGIQMVSENPDSPDELTMTLAGSLPIAYMPRAKRIANIGLGSGQTTHTLLASSAIEVVDTVEIEPAMVAASRNYGAVVARAYDDPRSKIYIEDAKTFFSLHNSVYDIIIAEPSNPWVSGVSSLFSTEFYRTIRRHLVDDGLFVQWIQLYEFSDDLAVSILKAMSRNFPDYVIYTTDGSNILLIARKEGRLPAPDWSALFDSEYAAELERINVRSPDDMLIRKYASRQNMIPLLRSSRTPVNSDYFPYVDLNAGRARFTKSEADMFVAWSIAPVPMLEMLHSDKPHFTQLTPGKWPLKARFVDSARWLYEQLTGTNMPSPGYSPSGDFVDSVTSMEAEWIRASITACSAERGSRRWRITVHKLMQNSIPFLDVASGRELIDEIAAPACAEKLDNDTAQWLNLYRALADRDADKSLVLSTDLLQSQPYVPQLMRGYALGATMLAAIAGNAPDVAEAAWDDYGEATYDDGQVPDYLRLLRSIAVNAGKSRQVAATP